MTGGTPDRTKPEYFGGDIKWLVSGDIHRQHIFDCEGRITELGMRNSNARILPANSVIIALNGQGKTRGTVAMLRTQATCNQSLVSIVPKNPRALFADFIYHSLRGRYEEINRITGDAGNERRGLNMRIIRSIEIPIPPLEEQRRIVAVLDEAFKDLDRARACGDANLEDFDNLGQSILRRAFAGELTENTNKIGWTIEELSEVLQVFTDGSWIETRDQSANGIRLIQTGNIGKGIYKDRPDKARYIDDETFDRLNCFEVLPNDCLISRLPDPVGRACIVPNLGRKMITAVDCSIVRPDENKISRWFLTYFAQSREYLLSVDQRCTGTTRRRISRKNLGKVPIPLPSLQEQQRIVEILDGAFQSIAGAHACAKLKIVDFNDLRQSILQRAFAGELT